MFNWFKRLNKPETLETPEVHGTPEALKTESIFPAASEFLKETQNNWPVRTPKEILKEMDYYKAKGKREAPFFESLISDETRDQLIEQGYEVPRGELYNAPFFKVRW